MVVYLLGLHRTLHFCVLEVKIVRPKLYQESKSVKQNGWPYKDMWVELGVSQFDQYYLAVIVSQEKQILLFYHFSMWTP